MHPTTFPNGTYSVLNTSTYTSQLWQVQPDGIRVYSAQSGAYAPQFICTLSHAEATEALHLIAKVRFPLPVLVAAAPVETLPPIGKPTACQLHRELGQLGYRDHYALAGEVLGRPVPSLAALTATEADQVRSYAYGQWGLTG